MSLASLGLYALLGMLLALPAWPMMRRLVGSRWGRRLRRNLPWSGWRPVFVKPLRH